MEPLSDEVPDASERKEAPTDIGKGEGLHPGDEPDDRGDPEGEVEQADGGANQVGVRHAAVLGEGGVGGPNEVEESPVAASIVAAKVEVWGDEQGAEGEPGGQSCGSLGISEQSESPTAQEGTSGVDRGVLIAMHALRVPVLGVACMYSRL